MTDVATHVRIFEPAPSDDFVEKRVKAVKDLATRFKKDTNVGSLISVADGLAQASAKGGELPAPLADMIEAAIQAHSTAFVRKGEDLQMLTIGLLALNQVLSTAKPSTSGLSIFDVLAHAAWLGFSAQTSLSEAKLEDLRAQVLVQARSLSLQSASQSRLRTPVPDLVVEDPTTEDEEAVTKFQAALAGPIEALRTNAALDREELDFLWWALGDYSHCLQTPYSQEDPTVVAAVAAIDAARQLRRMPCDAHKQVVFRRVRDGGTLTLKGLSDALATHRDRLASVTNQGLVAQHGEVFSVLRALNGGTRLDNKVKHSLHEWSARILLEAGFLRVIELLPGAKV